MRIRVALLLLAVTLRRLFRFRSLLLNGAIFAVPLVLSALGMIAATKRASAEKICAWTMWYFNLYFVLFFGTMVNALAATRSEIEDGSAYYIFGGVLPRWAVVMVKIAAVFLATSLFSLLSILGVFVMCGQLDLEVVSRYATISYVGVLIYTCFFVWCGYTFRMPVAATVVSTILFEWIFATTLPVKLAPYMVTNLMRALVLDRVFMGVRQPTEFFRYVSRWQAAGFDFLTTREVGMAVSIIASVFIGLSMLVIMRRSIIGKEVSH